MSNISHADLIAMQARLDRARGVTTPQHPQDSGGSKAAQREAVLHDQIREECKRRGWIPNSSRMDKRTGRLKGEPDFGIVASDGRTIYVEAKTATGKLSYEQNCMIAHYAKLDHTVYVVRSLADFLSVLRDMNL